MPMDQLNWKIIVGTSAIAIAFAAIVYRFAKTADPKQSTVADNIKKQKDTSTTATQQTQEVPRTGSFKYDSFVFYNQEDMDNVSRYKLIDQTTKDICNGYMKLLQSRNTPQIVPHLVVLYFAKAFKKDEQKFIEIKWNTTGSVWSSIKHRDNALYKVIEELSARSLRINYLENVNGLFKSIDQRHHGDVTESEFIWWLLSSAKVQEHRVLQNKIFQSIIDIVGIIRVIHYAR
eukprot:468915_1